MGSQIVVFCFIIAQKRYKINSVEGIFHGIICFINQFMGIPSRLCPAAVPGYEKFLMYATEFRDIWKNRLLFFFVFYGILVRSNSMRRGAVSEVEKFCR